MNKMILNDIGNMMLYPKKCKSFVNVDNVVDEWIRFLSYIKPEDVLFLKLYECKSLSDISDDEFEKQLQNYYKLSICEAYVLYIIRDIRYNNYVSELNRKINCEGFERASSLRKSLIKEYGKK